MLTTEDAKDWLDSRLAPDELAHYGVLGMRWGRRKDRDGAPTRQDIYSARKRIANRNVKIANVRRSGDNSIASQEKVKALAKKNQADNVTARAAASRKEAIASRTGKVAVASFIAAYGSSKVAQFSTGRVRRGARIVQGLLTTTALVTTGVAIGTGISAGNDERRYYQTQN